MTENYLQKQMRNEMIAKGIFNQVKEYAFDYVDKSLERNVYPTKDAIDKLKIFDPLYINITTHHSEYVYKELPNGQFERNRLRRRPGTIAIAAAISNKYSIPVIPHVICSGASAEDIEYELLDL